MNHLARLAGILAVLSVFAASSAALSMESPEELNITEIAEEETHSENITDRISYEGEEQSDQNTQDIKQQIKKRAERAKQDMMEDNEENAITGASTKSKPSEGLFGVIFSIFG